MTDKIELPADLRSEIERQTKEVCSELSPQQQWAFDCAIRAALRAAAIAIEHERKDCPTGRALELLWKEIVAKRNPKLSEWEYPGQAGRDILLDVERMVAEAVEHERKRMMAFVRWDLGDRRGFPKRWDEIWKIVEADWHNPEFMREQGERFDADCAEFGRAEEE